jgi:hypothetical protein
VFLERGVTAKKDIMLLAAMLTTAMFTAAPAFAQTGQAPEAGADVATWFTPGVGVLLIAGGLLVRRVFGKF